jgi:lipopolysaccharide transport system ATP-binding protein
MEFLREGEYWIMASSAVPKTEVLDEYKFETSFSIIDLTSPVAKSSEGRRGCVLPILKWNKI